MRRSTSLRSVAFPVGVRTEEVGVLHAVLLEQRRADRLDLFDRQKPVLLVDHAVLLQRFQHVAVLEGTRPPLVPLIADIGAHGNADDFGARRLRQPLLLPRFLLGIFIANILYYFGKVKIVWDRQARFSSKSYPIFLDYS